MGIPMLPNALLLAAYREALTRAAQLAQINQSLASCAEADTPDWSLVAWPLNSHGTEPIFWVQLFHPADKRYPAIDVWAAARRDARGYHRRTLRRASYGKPPIFAPGGNGKYWVMRVEVAHVLLETLRTIGPVYRPPGWHKDEPRPGGYPVGDRTGASGSISFRAFQRVFHEVAERHADVIYLETVFR